MGKEKYTITLEKELVEKAMNFLQQYGGKKSGLLNELLKEWVKKQENKDG